MLCPRSLRVRHDLVTKQQQNLEFYWIAFVNSVGPLQGWNTGVTQMWVQILFLPVIVTLGKLSDFLFLLCVTNVLNVSQIADKYKKEMCMKALVHTCLANRRLSSHPFCNWKLLLPE